MGRQGSLAAVATFFVLALWAAPAAAATLPAASFPAVCPAQSPGGDSYGGVRICSGEVTSFDGATLDVDVTQPMQGTGSRHPLIVMLHGFGNDKHEWESTTDEADGSDKYRWNSRWFAKHGYYVLTYTARGFEDDGPSNDHEPNTPSFSSESAPNGTIHLKSRDFEIRDTQWLAALVAATYQDVDPGRVAVTGGSYGGIESWLQASQAEWTFPKSRDATLDVLSLQAAVAKYPGTDLAYSLAPHGHGGGPSGQDVYESSQGEADSDTGDGFPLGVPKLSYINGLFALGEAKGTFESGTSTDTTPCTYGNCEGPISIPAWKTRAVDVGDPDEPEDPILRQIRRGLTEFRGAYYQDEGWEAQADGRKVAVFTIQGWTDDLFTAVEAFRMFKYLKRLDSGWPVEAALADVGHSRAQNHPQTWRRLNAQAFQFLQSSVQGSRERQTIVSSEPQICDNDGDPDANDKAANRVTATTPEGLASGTLSVEYPGGATANPPGASDPNGPATDAIVTDEVPVTEECRESEGPAAGGYTAYSLPLPDTTTYIGLGVVKVPYTFQGTSATLNARIFDKAPNDTELLVTRGTYRLNSQTPSSGVLELPLYGNHWRLSPRHQIRLDLTQVDQPTYRPSNQPSSIQFGQGVTLTLPTLESGDRTLGSVQPEAGAQPVSIPAPVEEVLDEAQEVVEDTVEEVEEAVEDVTETVGGGLPD